MLRQAGSSYEGGRSHALLKVKSAHDDEAVVRGHEAGKGKHTGRVGALSVVNRAGVAFKVGSGLTDAQRAVGAIPVGTVITYAYNDRTKANVPRFPRFVRVRTDVDAADITG